MFAKSQARTLTVLGRRLLSTERLVYENYGDPAEIVTLQRHKIPDVLQPSQILVEWRGAPINPADLNQLQGVYPVKPALPAVAGNEGSAWVKKVGASVKGFKPGDLVIPARSGLGTWRTASIHEESDLYLIDSNLDAVASSMFQVNPPTAYRMLHDFIKLSKGDTVIQNGGNSAVGKFVIQIARAFGWKTINVVRDRKDIDALKDELTSLGADVVYTEEELAKNIRSIKDIRLALNCVSGRSSLQLARTLGDGGCMVTYGGMSKQPVQSPTGPLIFKDISLRGFWMSHWYEVPENANERNHMYTELAALFKTGKLRHTDVQVRGIGDYKEALSSACAGSPLKQLLVFRD